MTVNEPAIAVEELPDTDASVPCEMLWLQQPCGQPAVRRVLVRCLCHHHYGWTPKAFFICQVCYAALVSRNVQCEFFQTMVIALGAL